MKIIAAHGTALVVGVIAGVGYRWWKGKHK